MKRSALRREALISHTNGTGANVVMHALPTERSKDTRTIEEIAQLIPWVSLTFFSLWSTISDMLRTAGRPRCSPFSISTTATPPTECECTRKQGGVATGMSHSAIHDPWLNGLAGGSVGHPAPTTGAGSDQLRTAHASSSCCRHRPTRRAPAPGRRFRFAFVCRWRRHRGMWIIAVHVRRRC
jgi:hypothetical protein